MFLPLVIVALLGTVSCHVSRDYDSTPAHTEYRNAPSTVAGFDEISGDTEIIDYSSASNITVRAAPASPDCKNINFEIGIHEIKGTIGLIGEWCSPGDNVEWSLTMGWKLKIFGVQLLNDKFHFNPKYSEIHRNLHLGVAKANIRLGVYNYCIKIIGEACYWAGKWRCADIYEVPHCFKNQRFFNTFLRSYSGNEGDDCASRMQQIAALAHTEL